MTHERLSVVDVPSFNAGVDSCRNVIERAEHEIAERFGLSLHRREIGEVFGVLAAELANLRIGPEPAPAGEDGPPCPSAPAAAKVAA